MPSEETKRKVEDLRTIECCPLDLMSSRARSYVVHIQPEGFH
jgi:hypothetical protein